MYLKSLTLRGFKSFPDRTRLSFSPGVSVVVGPNGCGKSNITDAILWALGEQSPLAVRGQSMQDVIFAGGRGQSPRRLAEVEVVIDNSEGRAASEFSEISIGRRIERSGEGEYRLNGARCRLADILEVLSDTNLGREMHSVISQGRVEAIVNSKPRDRRLLIEEAAGLGKARKRRHRAQLKLERTRENLDRALDVERESRSRIRPLKAQAEAAERSARIRREQDELQAQTAASDLRAREDLLAAAERAVGEARGRRDSIEQRLAEVAGRRQQVEERIAEEQSERRAQAERLIEARAAVERVGARGEALAIAERELRAVHGERQLRLEQLAGGAGDGRAELSGRIAELEAGLAALEAELPGGQGPAAKRRRAADAAEQRRRELERALEPLVAAAEEAAAAARSAAARRDLSAAELDKARRRRSALAGELAAVEARLAAASSEEGEDLLVGRLQAAPGVELALSAALGERLRAVLVPSREHGERHLREAKGAARALIATGGREPGEPPTDDARPLLGLIEVEQGAEAVAKRLLADAWLVEDLDSIPDDFGGLAVTIEGHCYDGALGELRSLPRAATDPALSARSEREELALRLTQREQTEARAVRELELAGEAADRAAERRDAADRELRDARRALDEATEEANRATWLAGRGAEADAAPAAETLRRAQLEAELATERRHLEAAERAHAARRRDREQLERRLSTQAGALPALERTRAALAKLELALRAHVERLERDGSGGPGGDDIAAELRRCSQREYGLQGELREASDVVTRAEIDAAQAREARDEAAERLRAVAERLERPLPAADQPLAEAERAEIEAKLVRLDRRLEKLGPVNPLAEREYAEARERLTELEEQRADLERALSELKTLIRRTDREIADAFDETFAATAENFEEMVGELFPGGRGRLRRVELGPRPVPDAAAAGGAAAEPEEGEGEGEERERPEESGVEIEVTPAGKAMRRLSLLSGGEKSLVALAFVFAVLLARPCPFYILDEVEAALDDINLDRFLRVVRRFSDRSQFIVVTHQKRTMDAADLLYGVSMGDDGITKVVSRRLPRDAGERELDEGAMEAAAEAA